VATERHNREEMLLMESSATYPRVRDDEQFEGWDPMEAARIVAGSGVEGIAGVCFEVFKIFEIFQFSSFPAFVVL
jgi:hypothetical protein